jgi:hypothetical protein
MSYDEYIREQDVPENKNKKIAQGTGRHDRSMMHTYVKKLDRMSGFFIV